MYKYLVLLSKETLEYDSKSDCSLFKRKTLSVNPISVIVEAYDADGAKDEVYDILRERIQFKPTILETQTLRDVKQIVESYGYSIQGVMRLED